MKQPARVLVVDDASDIREAHERFLRGSGMETLQAANGIQALDVARRVAPDVIVTDVDMPIMDGLSLCRVLRADEATRHVRVVVVTGDPSEQAQAAFTAGCDAILAKPCSRTILVTTIRRLLARG
jgi:CheY-like chemotaxis protein